jgi:hypothetical protein
MISPEDLAREREQAAARKAAAEKKTEQIAKKWRTKHEADLATKARSALAGPLGQAIQLANTRGITAVILDDFRCWEVNKAEEDCWLVYPWEDFWK